MVGVGYSWMLLGNVNASTGGLPSNCLIMTVGFRFWSDANTFTRQKTPVDWVRVDAADDNTATAFYM